MIGTPLVVIIKTVLPKSGGEWLTDYLIQLDEKPLSNGIKKFLKNEAVETVKYVSHNINLSSDCF